MTVPRYQARVLVRLRPSVLDPAGEATRGAAERLGVEGISKLRIGKAVELEVEAPDAEEARRRLEVLSDRLLANPVIEDWSLELQDSSASASLSFPAPTATAMCSGRPKDASACPPGGSGMRKRI